MPVEVVVTDLDGTLWASIGSCTRGGASGVLRAPRDRRRRGVALGDGLYDIELVASAAVAWVIEGLTAS